MSKLPSSYTKELLYQSFIKLTTEKPIEQITIQNILDDCNIARSTFYRYFRDKYELMSSYCFDKIASFKAAHTNLNASLYEIQCQVLCDTVRFVSDNQEYFSSIAQYSGQNCLQEAFIQHGKKYYRDLLNESLTNELCFAIDYHVYGESLIFLDWIRGNLNIDSDTLCELILGMMPATLSSALKEKNKQSH